MCSVYRSLSLELEPSWCCVSAGWKEVEAKAPFVQRAGQSEDPPMFRLHCVEKPRPEGSHMWFSHDSRRETRNGAFSATLTRTVVECLVSEWMQLLQDLVHGLFFVLKLLELGEFGCRLWLEVSVRTGGRMEQRSVLRRTNGLGSTGPTHLSRQRKALCLTTVVWNCFSLT